MLRWTSGKKAGCRGSGSRLASPALVSLNRSGSKPALAAASPVSRPTARTNQIATVTAAMPSVKRAFRQSAVIVLGSDELDLLDDIIAVARRCRDFDLVADRAS